MTPETTANNTASTPEPAPAPSPVNSTSKKKHGSRVLLAVVLLTLAGGAALVWWRFSPASSPPPQPPPVPEDVQEADVRQVIETTRQEVLENPRSADAWGRLGMILLAQLFDRDASRCFAEAARLDPTDARWPYVLGWIALKRDPDHALPLLRQAVALETRSEQLSAYRLQLSEALLERRELGEAEKLFRQEYDQDPNNLRAAYGLGLVALATDDDAAAEKFLTAAKADPSARKKATAELAALSRGRGDKIAAERYEKESAALPADIAWPDPFIDLVYNLSVGQRAAEREAGELEKNHRYAEAAEKYLEMTKKYPVSKNYVGAGINLGRLHQYDSALPLLREGVRLDPTSSQAQYTLALVLFSRAEKEWQQSPGAANLKDDFRDVIEHAKRAAEIKPNLARAYLFWGLSLKYLGDSAAAVAPLRQGVACGADISDLQFALGDVLLSLGQDREAETYLENARRLDPNDPRPPAALEQLRKKKS